MAEGIPVPQDQFVQLKLIVFSKSGSFSSPLLLNLTRD